MSEKRALRILISRLSHIGDCVLTLPLLNRLRTCFPESFIAWAVESPTQQLLELHPGIDQIVKIPKGYLGKPKTWRGIRKQLRNLKFDVAIDPQGISKSSVLCWLSGAPRRIGASGKWGRELSPWLNNQLIEPKRTHLVDRTLELIDDFVQLDQSAKNRPVEFNLPVDTESRNFVDRFLGDSKIKQPPVLINPGASWYSKQWVTERFGDVAAYIHDNFSRPCVISWAGEDEKRMAEIIASRSNEKAIIAPPTNLKQLAALCHRSEFFVGCDTGPMHIATAMGTPCVGLYGPTRPQDSGAYGEINVAIQRYYQSGSCKERRRASNDAMRAIEVDDVCRGCDTMFKRLASAAA